MAALGLAQVSSNQTCQLCLNHDASHFCNCMNSLTLFCSACSGLHNSKYPRAVHYSIPIVALNQDPQVYIHKYEALSKGTTALRRNIEEMENCCREFDELTNKCIAYLAEYRNWWLQRMQAEKEALAAAIEAAVQATANCLDQESEPVSGLAMALWTLSPEELQVFSYFITLPDLQNLCQTMVTYQNHLQSLSDRFSVIPQVPRDVFAAVFSDTVELYNIHSHQRTFGRLSVDLGWGGSFIALDANTMMCIGAYPAATAVYSLDLSSLQLTALPPLLTPRAVAGVAITTSFVYVFGGFNNPNYLNSCEKYPLKTQKWLPLSNMKHRRSHFTPCSFRNLIYLACPTSTPIESFDPETEVFMDLPVSFPRQALLLSSLAFVANEELFLLTNNKQMARWKINEEMEFRISATLRECWSTQPPLVLDSMVLIACTGRVQIFSLELLALI